MKRHIKNAGKFYALTVMILAVTAVAAFLSAQQKAKQLTQLATASRQEQQYTLPDKTQSVTYANNPVTGVKDDRRSSEALSEEAEESAPADNPTARAESFVLPIDGSIIKDYSEGELVYSKTMGDWRAHTGVDYQGAENEPVRAVNNGTVTSVTYDELWGTVVEIDHYQGMTVRYCGLNGDDAVKEGTKVAAGEKIGTLGKIPIESGDGVHLHLEIRLDGVYVDPVEAMGRSRD